MNLATSLMEHFLEGSSTLRFWQVNSEEKILYWLLFSFGLMYQCLNGAIPSRKCSITAPAKWRNSVYVLTEICNQRSKWLCPKTLLLNVDVQFTILKCTGSSLTLTSGALYLSINFETWFAAKPLRFWPRKKNFL